MAEKILVTKSSMPPMEEYIKEISSIWENHWMTNMGEKHNALEKELERYLGVPHISLFSNGHMALELAIQALELKGEVITTPFTFASTTHAIVRNGLKPVFCDIDPKTYTMDADKIESLITEQTSAILPVHVYGNLCDVEKIQAIADKHHLKVIYDAAHAFGETYNGQGAGTFGDISMFSFHATKVYNTIEGGAICYNDEEIGKRLYQLKNFGIEGPESVPGVGANAKMNEFQAAMGLCNLRHVNEEIEKRKRVYECYMEHLSNAEGIRLCRVPEGVAYNYAYFPVVFEESFPMCRDEIFETLAQQNICARKYFYPLTSAYKCYEGRFFPQDTPIALDVSKCVLTLPMYADLGLDTVGQICDIILGCERS